MRRTRSLCSAVLVLVTLGIKPAWSWQQEATEPWRAWSDKQKEEFLQNAEVKNTKGISVGIAGTHRLTLSDGHVTHDAHLQTIDEYKARFESAMRTELNFRDSYKYNIAAYRLDRLVGLNMIPVSVERRIAGKSGAVTWWADDVQMMEKDRFEKKMEPPNPEEWNDQMYQVRAFNQLVYNTDPNLGNLLITNDWKLVMIDFSRAFRWHKQLENKKNLTKIDRRFYEGLKKLDEPTLRKELGDVLTKPEISGVLGRRDEIIKFFNQEIAKKGEAAIICDKPGH